MVKPESEHANFDSSWKEILDEFLNWFMLLFFPKVHEDIDWTKGYESLDKVYCSNSSIFSWVYRTISNTSF